MIEKDLRTWLATMQANLRVFYLHLDKQPPSKFVWFIRAGDDRVDELAADSGAAPDIIYFDVEVWASSLDDLTALCAALRAKTDYRGAFGDGLVDDCQVIDQRDDYEPQASADTLPEFGSAFRLIVTGYEE